MGWGEGDGLNFAEGETKMTIVARLSLICMALLACSGVAVAHKDHKHKASKSKPWAPRKDCTGQYGSKPAGKTTTVTLAALFKAPKKYAGKMLKVKGKIVNVCRVKGCWMMLTDGKNKMRVRFKGYGFFMPTNSKGYGAVALGLAKSRTISVKMLRHYAMDAGKPELAKSITKPRVTVAFTASYVKLHKLPGKKK